MTRAQTIERIAAKLANANDEHVRAVAEYLEAVEQPVAPLRELTPRELELIEQSKEDFRTGRTLSLDEAEARTTAFLAARRAARAGS